ncbi:tubulin--tyrosine ligase-like protein 12 [Prorops nasuta]|uniref:tubulin--tyrosine ligase-like protein 12 n=1 Tax=Prorops nasuta TaxID=863751 RepID=UPI0034CF2E97
MDGMNLYHEFLKVHQPQLKLSGVPRHFWEVLFKKLKDQIFDSGSLFQLARIDYGDEERDSKSPVWTLMVNSEKNILKNDPNNIFLIDHAWMYDVSKARQYLIQVPNLLDRMCNIMGFNIKEDQTNKIDYVLQEMWRYNQSFSFNYGSIENRMPLWYIMDELGSAIRHSDTPNCRTVPFFYLPERSAYTLLFPITDIEPDDVITRDFIEGQTNDEKKRKALLLPWFDFSFKHESFIQTEPDEKYFVSGHLNETLPTTRSIATVSTLKRTKLKVFSEYSFVNQYLTDPEFEIVDRESDADILWLVSHFKHYKMLSEELPHAFVNQFPFEHVITVKDILSIICRRKAGEMLYDPSELETYPLWLPTTFNLSTELVQFVAFFEQRASKGLDNYWICKPWNLARGLDTHVTNNINHIVRLPPTGPKIAQKYVSKPVLYNRPEIGQVKFDIRYVLMLKSVDPLQAYVYKEFFLRFANKEFALNNFDVYEQHFTVMNYSEETPLLHVKCHDFLLEWEKQYPNHSWKEDVERKILKMFKEVLEAAIEEEPPKGIAKSSQSRAIYAVDLMLQWKDEEIQPVLLEINFSPDCERACQYYPDFYNNIFKCLFCNNEDLPMIKKL